MRAVTIRLIYIYFLKQFMCLLSKTEMDAPQGRVI